MIFKHLRSKILYFIDFVRLENLLSARTADKNKRINEIQSTIMKYKCKIPSGRNLCVRQSSLIRNGTNPFSFETACILIVKSLKGNKLSKTNKIRETD